MRDGPTSEVRALASPASELSGPAAIFRLSGGEGLWITVRVELGHESDLAADIVFRYLQRLGQALAGRLEWLQVAGAERDGDLEPGEDDGSPPSGRPAGPGPAETSGWPRHLAGPPAEAAGSRSRAIRPRGSRLGDGRRPDGPRPKMKPESIRRHPWTESCRFEEFAAPASSRPLSRHAPAAVPASAPDQPGRGEGPVGLPAGHAAAGLADPGGGRADGDRHRRSGPCASRASTRPAPRSRSSPPSSTRSSRPWSRTSIGRHDPHDPGDATSPTWIALLQSKGLAEQVVSRPEPRVRGRPFDDPAQELILGGLQVRPFAQDEHDHRHARGQGPARTKKLLETLLEEFKNLAAER